MAGLLYLLTPGMFQPFSSFPACPPVTDARSGVLHPVTQWYNPEIVVKPEMNEETECPFQFERSPDKKFSLNGINLNKNNYICKNIFKIKP
jgi:hypothetical protein